MFSAVIGEFLKGDKNEKMETTQRVFYSRPYVFSSKLNLQAQGTFIYANQSSKLGLPCKHQQSPRSCRTAPSFNTHGALMLSNFPDIGGTERNKT